MEYASVERRMLALGYQIHVWPDYVRAGLLIPVIQLRVTYALMDNAYVEPKPVVKEGQIRVLTGCVAAVALLDFLVRHPYAALMEPAYQIDVQQNRAIQPFQATLVVVVFVIVETAYHVLEKRLHVLKEDASRNYWFNAN